MLDTLNDPQTVCYLIGRLVIDDALLERFRREPEESAKALNISLSVQDIVATVTALHRFEMTTRQANTNLRSVIVRGEGCIK